MGLEGRGEGEGHYATNFCVRGTTTDELYVSLALAPVPGSVMVSWFPAIVYERGWERTPDEVRIRMDGGRAGKDLCCICVLLCVAGGGHARDRSV